uniref:Uncharacterized protein n=1 Tax=Esox lucius TaxID=8010 RepID=A0A3P8YM66_ESOLU
MISGCGLSCLCRAHSVFQSAAYCLSHRLCSHPLSFSQPVVLICQSLSMDDNACHCRTTIVGPQSHMETTSSVQNSLWRTTRSQPTHQLSTSQVVLIRALIWRQQTPTKILRVTEMINTPLFSPLSSH